MSAITRSGAPAAERERKHDREVPCATVASPSRTCGRGSTDSRVRRVRIARVPSKRMGDLRLDGGAPTLLHQRRLRRGVGPRRQDRVLHVRQLSGQRRGMRRCPSASVSLAPIWDEPITPIACLRPHTIARVKVRSTQCHIAQGRSAKHIFVARRSAHIETALVDRRKDFGPRILDDAEWEVALTAHVDATMAGDAALFHEERQTALFLRVERIGVAFEELVEARRSPRMPLAPWRSYRK
jgi:hypothetical protein